MKKTIALLSFLLAAPLWAEQQNVGGPPWKGLHDSDASLLINDNEAQDLLNVDITLGGLGVKKRSGYSQAFTLAISTAGVRGGYYFRDANGSDNLIFANDRRIYKSVNGSAFSTIVTTDTAGSYYDFSDSQGKLWRTTSNRDELLSYDGTTVVYYPTLPKGKQNEILPDRFVITGTTNTNTLYFSAQANFTNFTLGIEESDAFTEQVGLSGQDITAIKYAHGRVYIWTKNSFYFWEGTDQYNATLENISNTVGCDKPNSIVFHGGILFWQARDKFFYAFDGASLQKISNLIDTSTYGSGGGSAALTFTSDTDFNAGTYPSGMSASGGSVVYKADNGFVGVAGGAGTYGDIAFAPPRTSANFLAQSFSPTTSYLLSGGNIAAGCIDGSALVTTATIRTNSGGLPSGTILSTASVSIPVSANALLRYFSFSPSVALTAGTSYWLYISSSIQSVTCSLGLQNTSDGNTIIYNFAGSTTSFTTKHLIYQLFSSSAVYQSGNTRLGISPTSFGTFGSGYSAPARPLASTATFAIYVDSNTSMSYSVPSSFISSQTISVGQTPTLTPNTYVSWTANLARPVTNCEESPGNAQSPIYSSGIEECSPAIQDVTINYYDSNLAVNIFGVVDKDDRLIWSQAESGQTVPNISLIYDTKNSSWLKYSFPFESAVRVDNDIYFGGVSTGVVYINASGNNDAGSPITAYWQSKDFIGSNPYVEKNYRAINFIGKTQTSSNIDITWTVNTSSASTYNIGLSDTNGFIRSNRFLPIGKFGTFFNIRFGNDDTDAPFEVYSIMYEFEPRIWRVLP